MEALFAPLIAWLTQLATEISLEVFVVVAGFLEEIIAPIPSPFVMTTAAFLAKAQAYSLWQLAFLVVLASLAKTVSSYLVYLIADKAEDLVLVKFGKFFGVSHAKVEQIGTFLNQSWWDDVLLFLSRAIPLVPTSLVTVAAGVIKYNVPSFLIMTFFGTIIRNLFYLWIAYYGSGFLEGVLPQIMGHLAVLIGLGGLSVVALMWLLRAKDSLWEKVMRLSVRK